MWSSYYFWVTHNPSTIKLTASQWKFQTWCSSLTFFQYTNGKQITVKERPKWKGNRRKNEWHKRQNVIDEEKYKNWPENGGFCKCWGSNKKRRETRATWKPNIEKVTADKIHQVQSDNFPIPPFMRFWSPSKLAQY